MDTTKGCLLLIDDEVKLLQGLRTAFEGEGYEVDVAADGVEGVRLFRQRRYDLVLMDLMMPGETGLDILKRLQEYDDEVPVIMMTAYGTIETAVEAMKLGALDYVAKPFSLEEISLKVGRHLGGLTLRKENLRLREELSRYEGRIKPVYASAVMKDLFQQVEEIARTDLTILIQGASGVGKEVVARHLHERSHRADKPFIVVNCTVLSEGLIESELFGHEKGAFTGAIRLKHGKVEIADGGTLFLDEIGELPLSVQAKLLRFLQDHQFERVGGTKTLHSNVRVVAASNKNLEEEVKKGRFREDLFYRLWVIPFFIPPLAARPEDVPPLAQHFLERAKRRYSAPLKDLSEEALAILTAYPWPGNVRELENAIERAVIIAKGEILDAAVFGFLQKGEGAPEPGPAAKDLSLARNERALIERALAQTGGNILRAARLLEISRTTLYSKIEKHQINLSSFSS